MLFDYLLQSIKCETVNLFNRMGRSDDNSDPDSGGSGDLSNKDLMKYLRGMNERLKTIEEQNTLILAENKQIREELDEVKENFTKVNQEVIYLKSELNILKQQNISCDVIVTGVPDYKDEKLLPLVNEILKKYALVIKEPDIHSLYRFRNRTGYSPILICFRSKRGKEAIFASQKERGPVFLHQIDATVQVADKRRIVFKDRLTPENFHLLKEARKFKESNNFKYVWIRNSEQIVLRENDQGKPIVIHSLADIKKLQQSISARPSSSSEVIEING